MAAAASSGVQSLRELARRDGTPFKLHKGDDAFREDKHNTTPRGEAGVRGVEQRAPAGPSRGVTVVTGVPPSARRREARGPHRRLIELAAPLIPTPPPPPPRAPLQTPGAAPSETSRFTDARGRPPDECGFSEWSSAA